MAYTLVVNNAGPANASDAKLTTSLSSLLRDVVWTCVGADCPEGEGGGDIDAFLSLGFGASVTYEIQGTLDLQGSAGPVVSSAHIEPPKGLPDPVMANNTHTDTDRIGATGFFFDGFED